MNFQRILIHEQPFNTPAPGVVFHKRGIWPAKWISHPDASQTPVVVAYRCGFTLESATKFRLHVSADERYELFCDGQFIGRGPERGDVDNWPFETFDCTLETGEHTIVARVWSLGDKAPFAQMHLHHGFLACPENETLLPVLGTGTANWEAKTLGGYGWISPQCAWGTGWNQEVFGEEFDWNHENGEGEGWAPVETLELGARKGSQQEVEGVHSLVPARLGPLFDEPVEGATVRYVAPFEVRPVSETPIHAANSSAHDEAKWTALLGNESLEIAPNTKTRVLLDLNDYYCARPVVDVSGGRGARIDVHWSEGLYIEFQKWTKGSRDEIEGKFFTSLWHKKDGVGDTFWSDGGQNRRFSTLWWQSGRHVQILVETKDEPLTIHKIGFQETRYPLEMAARVETSDPKINAIIPICWRGLQECSHETYMDCPYFEQLMYVGDTRLEVLLTYALTRDDALPKKALELFDFSRQLNGLTQSRYPSRVRQIIPPFSLWWVAMVHDFALWRGDSEFVQSLLPGVRAVCDHYAALIDRENGLLRAPDGWNFGDWVKTTPDQLKYYGGEPKWNGGVPPSGTDSFSAFLGFQAALTFKLASEIENWFGESELSQLQSRRAQTLADATKTAFWNEERGLFADDLKAEHWSEHTQCLAIVGEWLDGEQLERVKNGLFSDENLARTTIYFSHYLFEACRLTERMDKFFERLQDWNNLVENGLKTTIEMPEPSRSDCHAWGAHPLFHLAASVAGIRPVAPGFSRVEIKPQLQNLEWIDVALPVPQGEIRVKATQNGHDISLPEGVENVGA